MCLPWARSAPNSAASPQYSVPSPPASAKSASYIRDWKTKSCATRRKASKKACRQRSIAWPRRVFPDAAWRSVARRQTCGSRAQAQKQSQQSTISHNGRSVARAAVRVPGNPSHANTGIGAKANRPALSAAHGVQRPPSWQGLFPVPCALCPVFRSGTPRRTSRARSRRGASSRPVRKYYCRAMGTMRRGGRR